MQKSLDTVQVMNYLRKLAELIRARNALHEEISAIIGRPALMGHVGEFVASQIFNIQLEESAAAKGMDGRFTAGPLAGKTVNIKWYAKHEGVLDVQPDALPDYYLVLAGLKTAPASSRGSRRPWVVESVYIFEAATLMASLSERGVKIGLATSVAEGVWKDAEVYPQQRSRCLVLTQQQMEQLTLFGQLGRKEP